MKSEGVDVKDLSLDLNNYRMTPQATEADSLYAMVSISAPKFWALVSSIIEDGYHPNEALIVLKDGPKAIVKEGNRRLAAMKLIGGQLSHEGVEVPDAVKKMIDELPSDWHATNDIVPCAIYQQSEKAVVDRLVRLIHGKGEQAAREKWNPVARARHNREETNGQEPGLDLLEKYLEHGLNVSAANRATWSGDYNLSVLDEAVTRVAKAMKLTSRQLVDQYPTIEHRAAIETILHDVGHEKLGFPGLRSGTFPATYGIGVETTDDGDTNTSGAGSSSSGSDSGDNGNAGAGVGASDTESKPDKPAATSFTDWKSVRQWFKDFKPKGNGRAKIVQLRDEARVMNVSKTPLAFCFLLRSMLEISAKAYCDDHAATPGAPVYKKSDGSDRKLAAVLGDVADHIIGHGGDLKLLQGAKIELNDKNGALSVTSLNGLIHNPNLVIDGARVCMMFGHIAPLLKAMND